MNNKKVRVFVTGFLSAIIYGIWTAYVNYDTPTFIASTLGQMVASFLGGYLTAVGVEFVHERTRKPWRFMLSAFGPYAVCLAIFTLVHLYIGTESIFITILPNIIIGTTYFILYAKKLEPE